METRRFKNFRTRRLKDYRGYEVLKVIDNHGILYLSIDTDGNILDCFRTLKELKKWADYSLTTDNERMV